MQELIDPKQNLGIQQIEFGEKISYSPVARYRGKTDKKSVIQLMSLRPMAVRFHYEKGVGYHYCWGGMCCERGNALNVRYVFPIVVFETDTKGKLISKNFEIQYLQVGGETYDNLILKYQVNPDLENQIMLVACSDEKYQRLTMELAGESPLVKDKEWADLVRDQYNQLKGHIPLAVAKYIGSDEAFLKILRKQDKELSEDEVKEFDKRAQSSRQVVAEIVDVSTKTPPRLEATEVAKEALDFVDGFDDDTDF